jgi:Transposase and inactivated derivatives
MAKYSFELKLKIVKDYISGEGGGDYLAKKYKISGKHARSQVRKWVNAYREFGEEGLLRKRKNEKYSVQTKVNAVELYLSTEMSIYEVANQFGVNNPPLISAWLQKYRENGVDGLTGKRGRPSMKEAKSIVCDLKKSETIEDMTPNIEKLLAEKDRQIKALQIENACLKEWRRLRNAQLPKSNENISKFIHNLRGSYQLNEILEVLTFPKSTYLYWTKRFDRDNPDEALETTIKEICAVHKAYGYRRVTAELKQSGYVINKKKVQRLMRKLKLNVVCYTRKSRKYNSYKGKVGIVCSNRLKRRFKTSVIHQKVTTDTTEFKYNEKDDQGVVRERKAYLNPFMDLYNLEILSYRISKSPTYEPIKEALEEAIEKTKSCKYRRTFHSDQGWSYQMKNYVKTLKDNKIFQSMSRKSNCLDNSPIENFFGLLKQEVYYGNLYRSFEELESKINWFINYYNNTRSKERLDYMSPVQYRKYHN